MFQKIQDLLEIEEMKLNVQPTWKPPPSTFPPSIQGCVGGGVEGWNASSVGGEFGDR